MSSTRPVRRTLQLVLAVLAGALLWVAAGTSPAGATDNPDYTAPPPTTVVSTPAPPSPAKTAVAKPLRTSLPITGSDATGTVVIASGLIALGACALVLRRRSAAGV